MPSPLLATKLHAPRPREGALPRTRLTERLNRGLHRKLTLIAAPAGFGKTTLAAAWLAGCDRSAAWLSLDEADGDPARFRAYLVAALRGLGLGDAVPPGAAPDDPAALTALLNELHRAPGAHLLVLDDYHRVESSEVDGVLASLLDHLPPRLHLALATREDPSLPLARLRAQGELTEIRAADLRFDRDEVAAFLERSDTPPLSPADVATLAERTEGWAAALQLAALSLRGRDAPSAFLEGFAGSHRLVADYLVSEVLERQPAEVQAFLLRTSVAERLCGPLCDALTGDPAGSGAARLAALERSDLPLVPLDDVGTWYRCHHLFAEVLRGRLAQRAPEERSALHRRAGAWFEAHGATDEAVEHALAAGEAAHAAELVARSWRELHAAHRYATVLRWLAALPAELRATRPELGVAEAWSALMVGDLEGVEPLLRRAERAGASSERALATAVAAARAYLAQARGDLEGTVRHARAVLEHAGTGEGSEGYAANDEPWIGAAATLIGLSQWVGGEVVAAERTLRGVRDRFEAAGNATEAISVTLVLAEARVALGRLRDAEAAYRRALRRAEALEGAAPPDAADLHRGLAELHLERDELDAADDHLARARRIAATSALPDWEHRRALVEGRLAWARGDLEGALERFEHAERVHVRTALPDLRPAAAWRVRALLALGRLAEAEPWIRGRDLAPSAAPSYAAEFDHLTLARALLARHVAAADAAALADATALSERLALAADAGSRAASAAEARALLALAHRARGDEEAALAALERALSLAGPEGYRRPFLEAGAPMVRLLATAEARGLGAPWAAAFRRDALRRPTSRAARPGTAGTAGVAGAAGALEEALTPRELDVLRLIAEGRTDREIARRLELALSTVKGYNRNIYGKLLVSRRTEAVARARELELL